MDTVIDFSRRALHRRLPGPARNLKARFSPTLFPSETAVATPVVPTEPPVVPPVTPVVPIVQTTLPVSVQPTVPVPIPPTLPVTSILTSVPVAAPTPPVVTAVTPSVSTTIPTTTSLPPVTTAITPPITATSAIKPTTTTSSSLALPSVTRTNIAGVETSTSSLHPIVSAIPTASAAPSGGVKTGVLFGGIVAAFLVTGGLVFAIVFFVRRWRNNESSSFDALSFRRSAVLMSDPPTLADTVDRGYNPRPPSMVERRLRDAATPVSYTADPQYVNPNLQPGGVEYTQYAQYGAHQSFTAGQDMPEAPVGPMFSPTSGAPNFTSGPAIFSPSSYGPNPFSPMPPSTPTHTQDSPYVNRKPPPVPYKDYGAAQAQYVTLDRASAAPFQLADKSTLPRSVEKKHEHNLPDQNYEEPHAPAFAYSTSPFADPASASSTPRASVSSPSRLPSTSSVSADESGMFFPVPPVPAIAGRARIVSTPPMLPELSRAFSPVFGPHDSVKPSTFQSPLSMSADVSGMDADVIKGHSPLSGAGMSFPTSAVAGDNVVAAPPRVHVPQPGGERKRPDTVYTVYDPEDAYGGI